MPRHGCPGMVRRVVIRGVSHPTSCHLRVCETSSRVVTADLLGQSGLGTYTRVPGFLGLRRTSGVNRRLLWNRSKPGFLYESLTASRVSWSLAPFFLAQHLHRQPEGVASVYTEQLTHTARCKLTSLFGPVYSDHQIQATQLLQVKIIWSVDTLLDCSRESNYLRRDLEEPCGSSHPQTIGAVRAVGREQACCSGRCAGM